MRSRNIQGEFNLHNLPGLDNLQDVAMMTISAVGWWGMRWSRSPRLRAIAVPGVLASCFLGIFLASALDLLTYRVSIQARFDEILVRIQEVVELLLGWAGFAYVALNRRALDASGGAGGEGLRRPTNPGPAAPAPRPRHLP